MSDLKYQLRVLLPSLAAEARSVSDAEIKSRYYRIKRIIESPRSIASCCRREGKSEGWFYKWAERLLKGKSLWSLSSQSRRPKRSPNATPKRIVKRIKNLRTAEPFSGPERISQDLKDFYNMQCSPSTIHNVLKREGLISTENSKRATKAHMKRYRRPELGYLQMDFKYVPYLIDGKQFYQLSVVDHHSSWRMIRAYQSRETGIVIRFLNELLKECPFAIVEIQTDNDSAFTDKFTSQRGEKETGTHPVDEWCVKRGIRHRLIPPGEKELNGKVENTHKQDDREHFSRINPRTLKALAILTCLYNKRWNEQRKTKALGWKTPQEAVYEAQVRILAWLLELKERYLKNREPLVKFNEEGIAFLPLPAAAKPVKPKIKTPRKSVMRRYAEYMAWVDGDEKYRKKS